MTERKVLNKYFPPDYDPSKIPRIKIGSSGGKTMRTFNIRTMAPFNMRCLTCNGYIYKAKKFNSRMETAENVEYLGLRHYRFFIRCPICCAEIIWRTDLESGDYLLESGAKRNFEALKTAEDLEAKRQAAEEEELANNPMKLLEKRTDQSKHEMEMMEMIEDLKQLNERQAGMEAHHVLLRQIWQAEEAQQKAEQDADEALIKKLLASRDQPTAGGEDDYEEKVVPLSDSGSADNSSASSLLKSSGNSTMTATTSSSRSVKNAVNQSSGSSESHIKMKGSSTCNSTSSTNKSKSNLSYMQRQLMGAVVRPGSKRPANSVASTSSSTDVSSSTSSSSTPIDVKSSKLVDLQSQPSSSNVSSQSDIDKPHNVSSCCLTAYSDSSDNSNADSD